MKNPVSRFDSDKFVVASFSLESSDMESRDKILSEKLWCIDAQKQHRCTSLISISVLKEGSHDHAHMIYCQLTFKFYL